MHPGPLQIFVDTGGTFTDCIARDSLGNEKRLKVLSNGTIRGTIGSWLDHRSFRIDESWKLTGDIIKGFQFKLLKHTHQATFIRSYDHLKMELHLDAELPEELAGQQLSFQITSGEEAPVLAARLITRTPPDRELPAINMKLGSTKGTNALLERKGAKTVFFTTRGFRDILKIGTQQRPDIFAIQVVRPDPLPKQVIEVDERIDAGGHVLLKFSSGGLKEKLRQLVEEGYESAAVCLINAYKNPVHEEQLKEILTEAGLREISVSTELSGLIKFLPRAETTVVNAYLAPIINKYTQHVSAGLGKGKLHVMTSAGGLISAGSFNPKDSLLSGPAGGVVGAAAMGKLTGLNKLITFDMGGTSTDVSRFDGQFDYTFELEVGNAHIFSPAISIETVAAGGGSVCGFDGFKLYVGPESAGADPGPACYGAGGPLTLTDINLLAGRLDVQQFSIPIIKDEASDRLTELIQQIEEQAKEKRSREEIIMGFIQIADEIMAEAINKISIDKGYNPAEYSMVAFGGAGGLHANGIAKLLNIRKIIIPKDAGLLSAFGISNATIERFAEKQVLRKLDEVRDKLSMWISKLDAEAIMEVTREHIREDDVQIRFRAIYLRFSGQDSSIEVEWNSDIDKVVGEYMIEYRNIYGYYPEDRSLEVESLRVIASEVNEQIIKTPAMAVDYIPEPDHFISALIHDQWQDVPVYVRDNLSPGAVIHGFAIVLDSYCTITVEQNWIVKMDGFGSLVMEKVTVGKARSDKKSIQKINPETELELFTKRFMAIAENMGTMFQRTALSVNVKERLDFSCALIDPNGKLVANAPHIPVHLGSLGTCVRALREKISIQKGDVIVTNHPAYGGSHLPDITLVSPVYSMTGNLIGYVVNRAHHAEIGGITPASMPANAKNLAEEGVIIQPFHLVKNGKVNWKGMRSILTGAPFPTRALEENIADMSAGIAANRQGEEALLKLVEEHGKEKVFTFMKRLRDHASGKMRKTLGKIPDGVYHAEELLDDGTPLHVTITVEKNNCTIDFSGSGDVHPGNLNATTAIVNSVVIYVLRLLINEPIPLNDGIFEPVHLIIPKGLLNPDFSLSPEKCPSIVGGNVEVSQRLTDTLLKAFGVVACSQGTMNNVMFGNRHFSYYETICGGCGAGDGFHGASAVHHHMTNTRITDPEVLELRYPVRLEKFEIRRGSGGKGAFHGGNGAIREITFLEQVELSLLSQHRLISPYGIKGGGDGMTGRQHIIRFDGSVQKLDGIAETILNKGDRLVIETPGGGGFGDNA